MSELLKRSEKAGHGDGSFTYRGHQVAPMVLGNPRSAVAVSWIMPNGYSTGDARFDSWREAKAWIDERADVEEV